MRSRLQRLATHPAALALVAAAMLYTLAGFSLAPWLVERQAPRLVAERTGHVLALDNVQVNPYLLRIELNGVALRGPDGEPVLSAHRVFADLKAASLLGRAWHFDAVRVEQPVIDVVKRADGSVNLADLVPDDAAPQERTRPPRLVVDAGAIVGGRLTFADRSSEGEPAIALDPIEIEVHDLATLPDREGRYAVSATLPDEARLDWRGDVSLQPLRSAGEIMLTGLRAKTLWPFLRGRVTLDTVAGVLAAGTHYTLTAAEDGLTLALDKGHVALTDVSAALPGEGAGTLRLASARVDGIRLDLGKRDVAVSRLVVADGAVAAHVDAAGTLDWANALRGADATRPPTSPHPQAPAPWRIRVDRVALEGIAADYTDASRKRPLEMHARLESASAPISIETGAKTTAAVEGLDATFSVSLRIRGDETPMVALPVIRLEDGRVDTGNRLVRAGAIEVAGGTVQLHRDEAGSLRLVQAFGAGDAGAFRRELGAAAEAARAQARPWRYALDALRVQGLDLAYRDAGLTPAFEYAASLTQATVRDVSSEGDAPMQLSATLAAAAGGLVEATGEAAQDFSRVQGRVAAKAVALPPAQPWLGRYARVTLSAGTLDAEGDVSYRSGDTAAIDATGKFTIADLRIDEQKSGERLLAWKAFAARDVRYASSPGRLSVREVRLDGPAAKVVIDSNRSVNFAQVLREDAAPADARDAPPASASKESAPSPFVADIQRVTLAGGTVDFTDRSLVLPFSTTVQGLDGAVLGVSTDRAKRAQVKAAGRIADYGAARVSGDLRPFAPTAYTNLRVEFDNVALPPLSPYTATFAGRTIDAGRLWLDLEYRIEDRQLLGENELRLANLRLGERVEAPRAVDLPLDLAIALLTDSQGRIELSVPVRGDLGSPRFDYGTVIREAIGNVVGRIVSAPFRALGALAGGGRGGATPDEIEFAAGEAEITPPEREKLDRIAGVLRERPRLALVVPQPYDPAFDTAALRIEAARRELAERLGRTVLPGEDPGPVDYGDADAQRTLERIWTERRGADAMARFAEEYRRVARRDPQRVNPVLGAFGRGSEDRAFYTALFERIVSTQPLPADAAQRLGAERASRIARYLTAEAGIDDARVRVGEFDEADTRGGDIAAKIGLAAMASG